MKSVGEILAATSSFLEKKKIERARRMAEELLAHALEVKRIDLYLQFDRPVEEEELSRIRPWVKRAAAREPIEYILGSIEFYGCKIRVDPRVLIPRPETEILVDWISKRIGRVGSAWDLCTGSGCIGIALKKRFPHIAVILSDLSPEALALARENSRLNGVDVELLQGDLFAPFEGRRGDLVVANPPYVSAKEYVSLDSSVREFEPRAALVGGERGIEFYERLGEELPRFLNPGAQVFLEIGSTQGDAVQKIFSSSLWTKRELSRDFSGKNRFFFLEMQ